MVATDEQDRPLEPITIHQARPFRLGSMNNNNGMGSSEPELSHEQSSQSQLGLS